MYRELSSLPEGLLARQATELHAQLGGPTLVCLEGRLKQPLFLTVLMHGNETTSWDALRSVLVKYRCAGGERELPRSLYLFIANTAAAEQGLRHLPGQPDYNRVWPGSELPPCEESRMMQALVAQLGEVEPFASVDIHNNTGLNPHYACVNRLHDPFLHLASMFCRTVVYFTTPKGVQSEALAALCPAVTLECGLAGEKRGIDHAAEFIEACLHLVAHPAHAVAARDIDLFHTTGVVKVAADVPFGFEPVQQGLQLFSDIEFYNFRELPAGTAFGHFTGGDLPLSVTSEAGEEVGDNYFAVRDGQLCNTRPVMPSMLTRDTTVIRQDCLCYLMERYPLAPA